jgi:hypothetical protein
VLEELASVPVDTYGNISVSVVAEVAGVPLSFVLVKKSS